MQALVSSMILPLAFFFLLRKVMALIVGEKESGMKEYLEINGCSKLAYIMSFMASEAILGLIVSIYKLYCLFDI